MAATPRPAGMLRRSVRWRPARTGFCSVPKTAGDDAADWFAGFRVVGEGGVLHALAKFKLPDRLFGIDGFVQVSGHE